MPKGRKVYVVSLRVTEDDYRKLQNHAHGIGLESVSDVLRKSLEPILGKAVPDLSKSLAALEARVAALENNIRSSREGSIARESMVSAEVAQEIGNGFGIVTWPAEAAEDVMQERTQICESLRKIPR